MADWRHENGLAWRALAPFGVEVDCDLSEPMSAAMTEQLVALFRETGLILARGQALSMEQQSAVVASIGSPDSQVGTGYISTEVTVGTGRGGLSFHSDYAYTDYPQEAVSLFAVDVVDDASSTRFASAERACANLPGALRERLAAHRVENVMPGYQDLDIRACELRNLDALIRHQCGSIVHNPRTGRPCLNVNEMQTTAVIGLDWEHSGELLREVYSHIYAPENIGEHFWRRGDFMVWDNVTFQHARGSLEAAGARVLQRVTLAPKGLWEIYPQMKAQFTASAYGAAAMS
jgi:taurine dioxygenase